MKTCSPVVVLVLTLLSVSLPAQGSTSQASRPSMVEVATLGLGTRAPTPEEAQDKGLKLEVRVRGRILTELEPNGPAAAAGMAKGDVLVRLGRNELFSDDDLADFLRVSRPGQKVEALLVRAQDGKEVKEVTVAVTLGAAKVEAPKEPALRWDFASLAQLPEALAQARKNGQFVLVGLSGAET